MLSATVFEHGDIAYFLRPAPARLERYDIAHEAWLSPVSLGSTPLTPTVAHADADGIYVAFDKSVFRYTSDGTGRAHLLDVPAGVSAVHSDGGLLFVAYGSGHFLSINKNTNTVIDVIESADFLVGSSLSAEVNRILVRTQNVSPADLRYIAYDDTGHFASGDDSPYDGLFPDATKTWVFPGGDKVLDDAGIVYATDSLTQLSSLAGPISDVDFSGTNIPIVLSGNSITAYSAGMLPTGSVTLPRTPAEIFVNATDVIAFTPDEASNTGYRADVIPLADLDSPVANQPVDPVGLPFTPDKIELASDGTLLLFSKLHQSLFRWNPAAQSFTQSIPLLGTPQIMAYSAVTNTAYFAYHSGLIRAIDFNAAQPSLVPFAELSYPVKGMTTARQYLFVSGGYTHHSFAPDGTLVEALKNRNYTSARYVWNDANQKLYFLREDTSPNDLQWEELNADGITYPAEPPGGIGRQVDSPQHSSTGFVEPVRVAPDGTVVVLGSGRIFDARTLDRRADTLGNTIADAAWLGSELFSIRTLAGVAEIQKWTASAVVSKVVQLPGTAHALVSIASNRLLAVTLDAQGVPQLTVLDENLEVIGPPPPAVSLTPSVIAEHLPALSVVGTLSMPGSANGAPINYSLVAGAGAEDNASFTIDGNVLKAAASFDFEAKARFTIRVRASDGSGGSSEQTFLVSISNVNEAPTIISNGGGPAASISVPENTTAITDLAATDPDMGNMLTYSISGGPDASRFSISPTTGVLRLTSARDFENPLGVGNDNVYEVVVRVSDGTLSDTQAIAVTITDAVNEPPRITSNNGSTAVTLSVAEGVSTVADVDAVDPDAISLLHYSVSGVDAARFVIDPETGVLTFKDIPSFENPTDAGSNNTYDIVVTASDGGLFDTQTFTVKVTDVNEPAAFEHGDIAYFLRPSLSRLERYDVAHEVWLAPIPLTLGDLTPTAAHADDDGLYVAFGKSVHRYSLDGTWLAHMVDVPDNVTAFHTDGSLLFVAYAKGFFLSINKVTHQVKDDFLTIYSLVGSSISPEVNRLFVRTNNASPSEIRFIAYDDSGVFLADDDSPYHGDFPAASRTWVFPGGAKVVDDAGIVYATNNLAQLSSFVGRIGDLDFAGTDLPIVLSGKTLTAYSAAMLPTGSFTLSEAPEEIFVNAANVIAFTPDSASSTGYRTNIVPLTSLQAPTPVQPVNPVGLSFTPDKIQLGADGTVLLLSKLHQSIFRWHPATQSFGNTIPLLGTPSDMAYSSATNTIYLAYSSGLIRKIDLGAGNPGEIPFVKVPYTAVLAAAGPYLFVSANDQYTFAPNGAQIEVIEGHYYSDRYVWSEANQKLYFMQKGSTPTNVLWREINANGVRYSGEPAGGIGQMHQSYLHTNAGFTEPVRVSPDGTIVVLGSGRMHDAQTLAPLPEPLDNTITDAAWIGGELFTIRTIAGVAQFQHWPRPSFALGKVVQTAGSAHALLAIAADRLLGVTLDGQGVPQFIVLDQNLNVIAGPLSPNVIAEHSPIGSVVGTLSTPGAASGQQFQYSLVAGAGADDNASFTIDGNVLKTAASFNFESQARFSIRVRSTDGAGVSTERVLTVSVFNVNEPPTITSYAGAATVSVSVPENVTEVAVVSAADPDGQSKLIYSISGGADAARFWINTATGALRFLTAPDFETPTDVGNDQVYDVVVTVSDGQSSVAQSFSVTVANVAQEPPKITSSGGGSSAAVSLAENVSYVMDVDAIDLDGSTSLTYSVGGADAAKFAIDPLTGVLTFVSPPNFEAPADSGGNNVYDVVVQVSDGNLTDEQAVSISITNVNEPLVAAPDHFETTEDSALFVPLPGVLVNDNDPDAGNNTKIVVSVGGGVIWDELIHGDLPVAGTLPVMRLRPGVNEIRGRTGDMADGLGDLDGFIFEVPADSQLTSLTVSTTRTVGAIKQLNWSAAGIATTGFIVPYTDLALLSNKMPLGPGAYQFVQLSFLKDAAGGSFAQADYIFRFNVSGNSNIGTPVMLDSGALLTLQANGSLFYDPNGKFDHLPAGQTVSDSFTYTIRDGQGVLSTSTVTIAIQGTNDAPQAMDDGAQLEPDEVLESDALDGLLANDVEYDAGDSLSIVAINDRTDVVGIPVTLPSGARVTVNADGTYRYDPSGRFDDLEIGESATDSFTYTVSDREGVQSSATVSISLTQRNDAPSFTKGANQSAADGSSPQSIAGWATNILPGGETETGQSLQFIVTTDREDLFVDPPRIDPTGRLTFTPAANIEGQALITVKLQDDGGTAQGGVDTSASQMFTISVIKPQRWQNSLSPLDASGDGHVAPNDALAVINYINAYGAGPVPSSALLVAPYYDVNGDNFVAASDVLDIINHLNAFGSATSRDAASSGDMGEGESSATDRGDHWDEEWITLLAMDVAGQTKRRRI